MLASAFRIRHLRNPPPFAATFTTRRTRRPLRLGAGFIDQHRLACCGPLFEDAVDASLRTKASDSTARLLRMENDLKNISFSEGRAPALDACKEGRISHLSSRKISAPGVTRTPGTQFRKPLAVAAVLDISIALSGLAGPRRAWAAAAGSETLGRSAVANVRYQSVKLQFRELMSIEGLLTGGKSESSF